MPGLCWPIPGQERRPKTLEPDGQATGCNPVEVGSTPTGVSFRQAAGPVGPAARLPRLRTVGGACSVQGIGTGAGPGRGSSEVEHQAGNLGVAGSTPVHNTPRSADNRLLGDVENVSTTGPEGNGRPDRSALVRTGASPRRDGRAGATRTDALKHAD